MNVALAVVVSAPVTIFTPTMPMLVGLDVALIVCVTTMGVAVAISVVPEMAVPVYLVTEVVVVPVMAAAITLSCTGRRCDYCN